MIELSNLAQSLEMSPTIRITALAKKLSSEGKEIVDLCAGEPDFNTPEVICEAAKIAIDNGYTRYTPVAGIPDLREAIASKYRKKGAESVKSNNVVVSNGGKQALFEAIQVTLSPDEEVLIPVPYWVSYPQMVKLAGAVPVFVEPQDRKSWKITAAELEAVITDRTRCLILNNPVNPSGACYSREEILDIAECAFRHNIFIIADDVYDEICYEGLHTCLISESPEFMEKVITVNSFSKTFAMTGWRIGYAICPEHITSKITAFQSQSTTNVNSITQHAALEGLQMDGSFQKQMLESFRRRRDLVFKMLSDSVSIDPGIRPGGAFYLFPSIKTLLTAQGGPFKDSVELAESLLREVGVVTVPGKAFGVDECLRLSVSCAEEELIKGINLMVDFLDAQIS